MPELFVIPPLVKKVMGIDIDRFGVSVVPIYGVHFDVYAKLFNELGLPKKCAIIADGDLKPSDSEVVDGDEESLSVPDIDLLASEYVGVFRCRTTFERALTIPGLLLCLSSAAEECGAPRVAKRLASGYKILEKEDIDRKKRAEFMSDLRDMVLATSKRFGKARFAQIVSKKIDMAEDIPKYIRDAILWLEL